MAKCNKCGYDNQNDYIFCMQCGTKIRETSENAATVISSEDLREPSLSEEEIPRTRVMQSLDNLDSLKEDELPGEKTKIFAPTESRINPQLVEIKDDLSTGQVLDITRVKTILGRKDGDILYPNDTYLSQKHCVFTYTDGKMYVEDLNSYNGVFIRIKNRAKLSDGVYILIGQQLLQFFHFNYNDLLIPEKPESEDIINFYGASNKKIIGLIKQIFSDRSEGNRYYISSDSVSIGRLGGDIIFPDDKFMSNKHANISNDAGEFWLIDNGSSNGVFLQIEGKTEINNGDNLLIGKQLFEYRAPTM